MFLSIEPASDRPLYTQIRNQIVDALVRGELVEGDRLPSVRQLAVDLGINLHTVNKAYRVLADDGYLSLNGRSGARIIAPPHYTTGYLEDLQATLARLFIEAQSQGIDATLFQTTVNRALAGGEPIVGEGAASCLVTGEAAATTDVAVYELAANQTIAAFSHPASGEGSAANVAANMATTEEVTATAKNAATAKVAAAKALAWKGSDHATRHPAHC